MTHNTQEDVIKEFKKMLGLMGYAQIWKHHPMGVARDVVKWFEEALAQAKQEGKAEGIREERRKIRAAWKKLGIQGGAAAGSAQGVICRGPDGEIMGIQVDRQAFKEFTNTLAPKEES